MTQVKARPFAQLSGRELAFLGVFIPAVCLALIVVVLRGAGDESPSGRYTVEVNLVGQSDIASVWVDETDGVVGVQNGRLGPTAYWVTETRLIVPAASVAGSAPETEAGFEWVSVPRGSMPLLDRMTPFNLSQVLIRDFKECVAVSQPALISLISVLVELPRPDERIQTCGDGVFGGGFLDGASVAAVHEYSEDPSTDFPPPSEVLVRNLGDPEFEQTVASIEALFAPTSEP